ncbi:MAG: flagellar protein FlgN [Thiohalobacteraceae bacterium]
MADREHIRTRIQPLLRAEYACAGRLNRLLDAETQALVARDVDAIERLIEDKQSVLQEFETLEAQMQQLLHDAGFAGAARPDVEGCLNWCDDRGTLIRGWRLVLERVRHAQQQNRINGATLESARRHAQHAVAILRGQVPEVDVYNPAGATAANVAASRTLAKA